MSDQHKYQQANCGPLDEFIVEDLSKDDDR